MLVIIDRDHKRFEDVTSVSDKFGRSSLFTVDESCRIRRIRSGIGSSVNLILFIKVLASA